MNRFWKSLAVVGAMVALAAGVLVSQQTVGAAQPPARDSAVEHLSTQIDLPNGAWTDTPLFVTLPRPGTYALDADVRGRLSVLPSGNVHISARLWNETTGAVVPQSERLVYQIIDHNTGDALTGGNQTAPISEVIRVSAPTTIRVQGLRVDHVGSATVAQIYSDGNGYTSLRYERL